MADYEEKYNERWKHIVENLDGSLNKDQIMRELSDFSMIIDNCTKIYSHVTGGNVSKPNTDVEVVINLADEYYYEEMKDIFADDVSMILAFHNVSEDCLADIANYFKT